MPCTSTMALTEGTLGDSSLLDSDLQLCLGQSWDPSRTRREHAALLYCCAHALAMFTGSTSAPPVMRTALVKA